MFLLETKHQYSNCKILGVLKCSVSPYLTCKFQQLKFIYCKCDPNLLEAMGTPKSFHDFSCIFLAWLIYKGWQIYTVMNFCFSLWFVAERKDVKDEWLKSVKCWRLGVWSVVSLKMFLNAPFDSTMPPNQVQHSLEVSFSEFQWYCRPCLFGFCGEWGHQRCKLIGYYYSACSPCWFPLFFFLLSACSLNLSLCQPLNYRELSHLAHFGHQKIRCCVC